MLVWEMGDGVVDVGWTPLPTRLQQYLDPASLGFISNKTKRTLKTHHFPLVFSREFKHDHVIWITLVQVPMRMPTNRYHSHGSFIPHLKCALLFQSSLVPAKHRWEIWFFTPPAVCDVKHRYFLADRVEISVVERNSSRTPANEKKLGKGNSI